MWGDGDPRDISYNIMAGLPSDVLRATLGNGWSFTEATTNPEVLDIVNAIKSDLIAIAKWLERFDTRRGLWSYLLANRDPVDHREFTVPALLPMKLATAAALALSGNDQDGCALMPEVRSAMKGFRDKQSKERLQRLEQAAAAVCA
jgi:hypothetical protein